MIKFIIETQGMGKHVQLEFGGIVNFSEYSEVAEPLVLFRKCEPLFR